MSSLSGCRLPRPSGLRISVDGSWSAKFCLSVMTFLLESFQVLAPRRGTWAILPNLRVQMKPLMSAYGRAILFRPLPSAGGLALLRPSCRRRGPLPGDRDLPDHASVGGASGACREQSMVACRYSQGVRAIQSRSVREAQRCFGNQGYHAICRGTVANDSTSPTSRSRRASL
jgi:hypothetical protein